LMRTHLAEGGLILAATHAALGLAGAKELRLGELDRKPISGTPPDGESLS
ncbi:MAG TPA: heme ABC transporter ATP-binding protein CcmA, partial [Xanthobacteraceae bacterium]